MTNSQPWLLTLATRQRGRVASTPVAYDEARQIAVVEQDGLVVPAIDSERPPQTKKADIEKAEDQKDRWWQS